MSSLKILPKSNDFSSQSSSMGGQPPNFFKDARSGRTPLTSSNAGIQFKKSIQIISRKLFEIQFQNKGNFIGIIHSFMHDWYISLIFKTWGLSPGNFVEYRSIEY